MKRIAVGSFAAVLVAAAFSLGAGEARPARPGSSSPSSSDTVRVIVPGVKRTPDKVQLMVLEHERTIQALRAQVATLRKELSDFKQSKKELWGSWRVVSVQEGGESKQIVVARLIFHLKSLKFVYRDGRSDRTFTYKTDPLEEPKEIDISGSGTQPIPGIYELDRDTLRICLDRGDAARPSELNGSSGGNTTLWVLERELAGPQSRRVDR